jgi:nitroreductase
MSANPVLEAIRERRSVCRFKSDDVGKDHVDAILEAGRWAPSFLNSQPWSVTVVRDKETRHQLRELATTITKQGIEESPVVFVVSVDTAKDPYHYVEDGAAVTQNMALTAHSLGLASFWVGVYDTTGDRRSSENRVKKLLAIPEKHRVISMLPVGYPLMGFSKERKPVSEFVFWDAYGKK